ncbi:MAG: alpha/beta fold hydrolase [Planctomycetota bacterium]
MLRVKSVPFFFSCLLAAGLSSAAAVQAQVTTNNRLVDRDARLQEINTPEEWATRRKEVLEGLQLATGKLPSRTNLPPLDLKESKREEGHGFTKRSISFTSGDGDRVPAHLYVPRRIKPGNRLPAMLALHPTSPIGKDVVAGLGLPNRQYAVELAQRGYVVIAPDYPSFGELKDYDFAGDRYESGTMKGIVNHMRSVDLLQSLPYVDDERIGVIGHSLGGHNAIFAAVFDERLKVVVSSCGWTPFHDYYGGKIAGWTSDRYLPKLREVYGLDPDRVPFDWDEVIAALAPRPFFTSSPLRDANFDVVGVMRTIPRARAIYKLLGAENAIQLRAPNCEHDFPPNVRRQAYAFVDRALKQTPARVIPKRSDGTDPFDRARFSGPWNLEDLARAPKARWGEPRGVLRGVHYEGEMFDGNPTEVFAWYATPPREKFGDGPFPAMLLVHGGGGRAFEAWAQLWANRGYVALAMDTAGQGPRGKRHEKAGPAQSDNVKFRAFHPMIAREMWTYHAVAAVLRGHSLLRARKEVHADRIGITGISWGGYLTCIVAGIDPRLKVAVPVYGCGFLHENSYWLEPRFQKMPAKQRDLWVSYFDPSRYVAGISCPTLFLNGTNDFAYPPDSYRKTWRMVHGDARLSVQVRLPHGHSAGWTPDEIARFVDGVLLPGAPGLPRVSSMTINGYPTNVSATFTSKLKVKKAALHYTTDVGPWQKRHWKSAAAAHRSQSGKDGFIGFLSAMLPKERPIVFYLSVTDDQGGEVSTPHETLTAKTK